MCSKSFEPLVGIYIFIDLEVQNLIPFKVVSLVMHTHFPSASAIFGNTPGTQSLEWCPAGALHSARCPLLTQIRSLPASFSAWKIAKCPTEPCRVSMEPNKPQDGCVWLRNPELHAWIGCCIVIMQLPRFCCPQIRSFASHSIMKAAKDLLVVLLCDGLALWCVLMMHHSTGIK